MGRYKRRPRIDEDNDNEVKPNQTPPTKRRRMLEPKSLHMPPGSQQVIDDDYDTFAVTVHQPANNSEEMMSSTKEMSSSLAPSANTIC